MSTLYRHIILVTLALIAAVPAANAQLEREAYMAEMHRKIQLQDSLRVLEARLGNATRLTDSIAGASQRLERETQRNERDYRNMLSSKSRDIALRERLLRETDSLNMLATLNERNVSIIRTDLESRIEQQTRSIDNDISRLDDVRNSVITSLELEVAEIEELPYSQMDAIRIRQLTQRLAEYGSDSATAPLRERLFKIQTEKNTYDMGWSGVSAVTTTHRINELQSQIASLQPVSFAQQQEKEELATILEKYAPGANALRAYVTALNRKRDGATAYSVNSLHDDQAIILDRNNGALRQRIEGCTLAVPALSHLYDTFNEELESDPQGHSYTETLILNLDNF